MKSEQKEDVVKKNILPYIDVSRSIWNIMSIFVIGDDKL